MLQITMYQISIFYEVDEFKIFPIHRWLLNQYNYTRDYPLEKITHR